MREELLGAVEAGGTKFNCAVGRGDGSILRETRIETRDPGETLGKVLGFFEAAEREMGPLAAFGIGSFGPIHLVPGTPEWGRMGATPKPGWSDIDMAGPFIRRFGKPVGFDTDVNGAALGELLWGAAQDCRSAVYVTIGTGVGGGAVVGGRPLHGLGHAEMGHIAIARHASDAGFGGVCPFHGDCVEGLISGPAIVARFGRRFSELEPEHPFRAVFADYVGGFCAQIVLMLTPERIIVGGGVMEEGSMHEAAAEAMRRALGGYVQHPALGRGDFLVPPGLGQRSGVMGALALAREALERG